MTVDSVTEIVKVRVVDSEVVSIRKESRFVLCSAPRRRRAQTDVIQAPSCMLVHCPRLQDSKWDTWDLATDHYETHIYKNSSSEYSE